MSDKKEKKLGLGLLVALGVGSMIGGGVFNSPTDFIKVANPQAATIAWIIGGFGVICLALIFQLLAEKRPELTGGIYSYAKVGFGDLAGFVSAWGYWVSGWFGNVAFFTLLMKTFNSLLGPNYQLKPIVTYILSVALLWLIVFIQTRGSRNVGVINFIVTICKLIPLAAVIILGAFVFDPALFNVANWHTVLASAVEPVNATTTLGSQINSAMGTILWCFIGVEASVVLAEKAESQKIVGKATVLSIIITLAVYVAITLISMGVIPATELVNSGTPLADVLSQTVVGSAGGVVVKVGLMISLLGALLSWVMIAAQLPYVAAKEGVFPKMFGKSNDKGVPTSSLYITNGIASVFFLVMVSDSLQAVYGLVFLLATACILIPYLLSSIYALRVCKTEKLKVKDYFVSIVGIVYILYTVFAVGLTFLAASCILYAIGMFFFIKAKKEQGKVITNVEKFGVGVIMMIAVVMIVLMATGTITL